MPNGIGERKRQKRNGNKIQLHNRQDRDYFSSYWIVSYSTQIKVAWRISQVLAGARVPYLGIGLLITGVILTIIFVTSVLSKEKTPY